MNKGRLHLVLIIIGILALAVFGMKGLSNMKKVSKAAIPMHMKRHVKVEKVEYDTISTTINATGRLGNDTRWKCALKKRTEVFER